MNTSSLALVASALDTLPAPTIGAGVGRSARKASAKAAAPYASRILVVDDDPGILHLTETMLVAAGYGVYAAPDAQRALSVFRKYPTINLLLTDIHMPPGINGLELAEIVSLERPDLPIVVVSGAILTAEHEKTIRSRSWAFVDKPLSVPRLLSVIALLLRGPSSRSSDPPFPLRKAG